MKILRLRKKSLLERSRSNLRILWNNLKIWRHQKRLLKKRSSKNHKNNSLPFSTNRTSSFSMRKLWVKFLSTRAILIPSPKRKVRRKSQWQRKKSFLMKRKRWRFWMSWDLGKLLLILMNCLLLNSQPKTPNPILVPNLKPQERISFLSRSWAMKPQSRNRKSLLFQWKYPKLL